MTSSEGLIATPNANPAIPRSGAPAHENHPPLGPDLHLRVLRICSVFEPPPQSLGDRGRRFDPIGGMQNHTAELTRNLARYGVKQTVVTTWPPGADRQQTFAASAEVWRLGWEVPYLRQLYALHATAVLPALSRGIDLVHVHLGEDVAVVPLAMTIAKTRRVPLVLTVHCSPRHTLEAVDARTRFVKTVGGFLERRGELSADRIIVITPRLAGLLKREGIPASKISVIPSGADPELFRGPFSDPLPRVGRPRVLFVGRLARHKGIFDLLAAHARVHTPASLVFVGDGPDRAELEKEIAQLRMTGRVHVTGFVPHADVPAYLAHGTVLCLPSHFEELGSILIEGMQLGLPLVAARTGGIPDAVTDGHNGLLVEPRDPGALAQALEQILCDGYLARRLSTGSLSRSSLYLWPELAKGVLRIYQDVTSTRR